MSQYDQFVLAAYLNDAPIDRVGYWSVCWRLGKAKVGLSPIVVEASLPDGYTERTILPGGCVLVLGEESHEVA